MTKQKQKICFIVNPFSGVGKKQNLRQRLERLLDLDQYDYSIQYTEYPGHATELAAAAVQEAYDIVVAVGGDGSVNEVMQALIGTNTTLGILPAGSGNGLAMSLGIGRRIDPAIQLLNRGRSKTIDSCQLNGTPFINIAGLGFAALVAQRIKNSRFRGFFGYLWLMLRYALPYRARHYRIWVDGKKLEGDYVALEVANGPMYGYNFVVAAFAKFDDAQLDLVLIRKASKLRYLLSAWRFLTRTVHKSRLVESY
ncbi:MAG: diacylglycerol kinase family protein, partial [Bacteroidota bacterium]